MFCPTGAAARGRNACGAYEAPDEDARRACCLGEEEVYGRASIWSNQSGDGISSVSAAGIGVRQWRMSAGMYGMESEGVTCIDKITPGEFR